MEIRFAQGKDVPGILALLRQAGQARWEARPDLFRQGGQEYGASQVLSMLNDAHTPVFVAAEGEIVLAYAFCTAKDYDESPRFAAHTALAIEGIWVEPSHRRQGVGTALLRRILRYAEDRRCRSVTMDAWCGDEATGALCRRLGMAPQKISMERRWEDGECWN